MATLHSTEHDPMLPLELIVRGVLGAVGADGWRTRVGSFWCQVDPPISEIPAQGWKLHVSATPLSAPHVLWRAANILVRSGCAFKFAKSLEHVFELVDARCQRGSGGKFITAYPPDEQTFRILAESLDHATHGLPGPVILSDAQYRDGSLVHYRYGGFVGRRALGNDGKYEPVILRPDGQWIPDPRNPWFTPPTWAALPFGPQASVSQTSMLLASRFRITGVVQHANKGGVFRAFDEKGQAEVIIKQARAHVGSTLAGVDCTDRLRSEAEMLQRLEVTGLTPRKIELFSQSGDLFLAEELMPGVPLRKWVENNREVSLERVVQLLTRIVGAVKTIHSHELVLQDLSPNNILVSAFDGISVVDLEHVREPGSDKAEVFTPGYAPPERQSASIAHAAAQKHGDLFSLGAVVFFTISGLDPLLANDRPSKRPLGPRWYGLLENAGIENQAARFLSPLALGLMHETPEQRWSLTQAENYLRAVRVPVRKHLPPRPRTHTQHRSGHRQRRLLADGLRYLGQTMNNGGEWLWPAESVASQYDPCGVHHGAAGVLGMLTQVAHATGDTDVLQLVRRAVDWLLCEIPKEPRVLPGLSYGRSGTAWALHDAADLLGHEEALQAAMRLAQALPVQWSNPDVCHGLAGSGMALLHLWRSTGSTELESRLLACADSLASAAQRQPEGLFWFTPPDFPSAMSGLAHFGLGHGLAGIGTFFLGAGLATGKGRYRRLAIEAGETLLACEDQLSGRWPKKRWLRHGTSTATTPDWCSGSSGVGTFLLRLWLSTGETSFLDAACRAAHAAYADRFKEGTSAYYGIAGIGEYILDLAQILGDPDYQEQGRELADSLYARNVLREGLRLVPDDTGLNVNASFGAGLAGILGFLTRLVHGTNRLWLPADCTPDTRTLPTIPRAPTSPVE